MPPRKWGGTTASCTTPPPTSSTNHHLCSAPPPLWSHHSTCTTLFRFRTPFGATSSTTTMIIGYNFVAPLNKTCAFAAAHPSTSNTSALNRFLTTSTPTYHYHKIITPPWTSSWRNAVSSLTTFIGIANKNLGTLRATMTTTNQFGTSSWLSFSFDGCMKTIQILTNTVTPHRYIHTTMSSQSPMMDPPHTQP